MSNTRKIVINTCFGGFSLSPAATVAYGARKGLTIHCFRVAHAEDGSYTYKPFDPTTDERPPLFLRYSRQPLDDEGGIPDEALFSCRDMDRDDPDLVAIVEEMGAKADGGCAELKIVEIPAEVEWQIEEYDGREHVSEKHRTWC